MVTRTLDEITGLRRILPFALAAAALAALAVGPEPAQAAPDRARIITAAVQQHLGLYVTTPQLRDAGERVVVQRDAVEAWFLRPISPRERDTALCEGARWLLTGRMEASLGAKAFFAARSGVDQLTLVFYDVETALQLDRKGRYVQRRTARPEARFTISRARAGQLDPKALEQTLRGARCSSVARSLLDTLWTRDGDR